LADNNLDTGYRIEIISFDGTVELWLKIMPNE